MSGYSALDQLTFGEMFEAAECCARAAATLTQPMDEADGMRRYRLRNAVAKLLSAALQVEPTAADFDRCAAIMRMANGG